MGYGNDLAALHQQQLADAAYGTPAYPGHVQPHEEDAAKALIDAQFIEMTGKPFDYKTSGYLICVKIYIRPEELKEITRKDGTKVKLYRPIVTATNDKYQSVAALVLGMGPDAYKDKERYPSGPWCRIGDWVNIPRYEAHLTNFRGIAIGILPEDRIMGVISDPNDVTPIHQDDTF